MQLKVRILNNASITLMVETDIELVNKCSVKTVKRLVFS